jgi:hypothetical protein
VSAVAPSQAAGTLRARIVIVFGTGGGIYLYSPVPGAGNLVASITNSNTDPFGNHTLAGGYANYNNAASGAILYATTSIAFFSGSLAAGWTGGTAVPAISFTAGTLNFPMGGTDNFTFLVPSGDVTGATDTANITAVLGVAVIQLAPSAYYFDAAWAPVSGTKILGAGYERTTCTWVGSAAVDTTGSAEDVEIGNLTMIADNTTGHDLFSGNTLARRWYVHDCNFVVGSNVGIWNSPTTQLMIECRFARNLYTATGNPRNVPCWFMSAPSNANQVNVISWEHEVFLNNGPDSTQYVYHVVATGAGVVNAGLYWNDIVCEHPYGGMILVESCDQVQINGVLAWDTTGNIAQSLIKIIQNSSGPAQVPANIVITGSGRNGAPNFTGPGVYDLELDSGGNCKQVTIDTFRGNSSARLNLGGCTGVKLINQPAGTVLTNGSASAVAGSAAGGGPPAPILQATFSTEAGTFTFGTGAGPSAGQMCVVTFGCPFSSTPAIGVDETNLVTQQLGLYVDSSSVSATGFAVYAANAPAGGQSATTYGFRWRVFQ